MAVYGNTVATFSIWHPKWRNKETPEAMESNGHCTPLRLFNEILQLLHAFLLAQISRGATMTAFQIHPELRIALQSSYPLLCKVFILPFAHATHSLPFFSLLQVRR